jgi:predicted RNA-binding Zn-ribbon protein involved in translation (DUF1610 family)
MKFREPSVSYTVRYHGNEYMEEIEEEQVYLCPECMSVNVRDANNDDAISADYVCNECGCKFDVYKEYKLTRSGRIAENVCNILALTFAIFAVICVIGGLVFAGYVTDKNGGDLPDLYYYISLAIGVGGSMICGSLTRLFAKLYDKI